MCGHCVSQHYKIHCSPLYFPLYLLDVWLSCCFFYNPIRHTGCWKVIFPLRIPWQLFEYNWNATSHSCLNSITQFQRNPVSWLPNYTKWVIKKRKHTLLHLMQRLHFKHFLYFIFLALCIEIFSYAIYLGSPSLAGSSLKQIPPQTGGTSLLYS